MALKRKNGLTKYHMIQKPILILKEILLLNILVQVN